MDTWGQTRPLGVRPDLAGPDPMRTAPCVRLCREGLRDTLGCEFGSLDET
jgi:hypothetical protein